MRRSFLLLFFLTISHLLVAQQGTLTGKITDKKTNEGAIGATVLVTGTVQAAPVEIDGTYVLKLAAGTYTITVQSVGYKPLTFQVLLSGPTRALPSTEHWRKTRRP